MPKKIKGAPTDEEVDFEKFQEVSEELRAKILNEIDDLTEKIAVITNQLDTMGENSQNYSTLYNKRETLKALKSSCVMWITPYEEIFKSDDVLNAKFFGDLKKFPGCNPFADPNSDSDPDPDPDSN